MPGGEREADLAAWYDRDAAGRSTRPLDPERVRRRQEFTALLRADVEGPLASDAFDPPRFFSFRSPGRLVDLLSRHGEVARSEVWAAGGERDDRYQWVLLRLPGT
ncbi:hypothetical protein [Modestobacter sp. SYSU DS0511]